MTNSATTVKETVRTGMVVHVNDEARAVSPGCAVSSLVAELGLTGRKGVAVAVNGNVVPRSAWPAHALRADDRVLVIQATQGG